jgi:hypothetical protein
MRFVWIGTRNLEFVRTVAPALHPPAAIMLVVGMGFVFAARNARCSGRGSDARIDRQANAFGRALPGIRRRAGRTERLYKVTHQQIDLLLSSGRRCAWVNTDSPKVTSSKLLLAADPQAHREVAPARRCATSTGCSGHPRHDMMFSCLFSVDYVVVRYRKAVSSSACTRPRSARLSSSAPGTLAPEPDSLRDGGLYLGIGTIVRFHSAGNMALLPGAV